MKLIGAGFGRTGTMSLKAAIEQLGYGPCFVDVPDEPFPRLNDTAAFREMVGLPAL